MDDQLVRDYVLLSLDAKSRNLQTDCEQLKNRLTDLENEHERKTEEAQRLRSQIKNVQLLKESTLVKMSRLNGNLLLSSANSSPASPKNAQSEPGCSHGAGKKHDPNVGDKEDPVERDVQNRKLALELQLVMKERATIAKQKEIVDQYEKQLHEKRAEIESKDQEIQRLQEEVLQKRAVLNELRKKNGSKCA